MNQSKGIVPVVAICAIVAAVFLTVSLVAPFIRTSTFWVAFAFVWVALLVAIGVNLYVVLTARPMKSALYRASMSAVSVAYFCTAVVASLVFMIASSLPSWILIIVQVVLLALCLLGTLGGEVGARLVEGDEARTQAQTSFIQNMRMQASRAVALAPDGQTRRALEQLDEKLRFTDPVSSAATGPADRQIEGNLAGIYAALQTGNSQQVQSLSAQTIAVIDQRAALSRSMK